MADIYGTIFEQMLWSQKDLNDEITPDWMATLSKQDYLTAVLVEVGEAIDSLDYKWWKAGKNDWDNFKVELVDVHHFLLSALWYDNEVQRADACYFFKKGLAYRVIPSNGLTDEKKLDLIKEYSLKLMKVDNVTAFMYLGRLFRVIGLVSLKEIAREFLVKNTLNLFRTRNGYKQGTYKKMWKGKEDNVIAYALASDLKFTKFFTKDLYKKLEDYYNENVRDSF